MVLFLSLILMIIIMRMVPTSRTTTPPRSTLHNSRQRTGRCRHRAWWRLCRGGIGRRQKRCRRTGLGRARSGRPRLPPGTSCVFVWFFIRFILSFVQKYSNIFEQKMIEKIVIKWGILLPSESKKWEASPFTRNILCTSINFLICLIIKLLGKPF